MAIVVSQEVYDGLEEVRESGETNMFDRLAVIDLAYAFGYTATAEWVNAHKTEYAQGVFDGFEVG